MLVGSYDAGVPYIWVRQVDEKMTHKARAFVPNKTEMNGLQGSC